MVLTVTNQKGGVAKTTTAAAIASGARAAGLKVLSIDLDPQANLTLFMGGDQQAPGARELLEGDRKAAETIQATDQGDLVASGIRLAGYKGKGNEDQRRKRLKYATRALRQNYDLIVIDTPPALGELTTSALVASDEILVPITADIASLNGLYLLNAHVEDARKTNKRLKYAGVVFTRWSGRTIQDRDLREVITENCKDLGIPVCETVIREAVAAREAQSYQMSIHDYAPKSKPAQDYRALLDELGITDGSTFDTKPIKKEA